MQKPKNLIHLIRKLKLDKSNNQALNSLIDFSLSLQLTYFFACDLCIWIIYLFSLFEIIQLHTFLKFLGFIYVIFKAKYFIQWRWVSQSANAVLYTTHFYKFKISIPNKLVSLCREDNFNLGKRLFSKKMSFWDSHKFLIS